MCGAAAYGDVTKAFRRLDHGAVATPRKFSHHLQMQAPIQHTQSVMYDSSTQEFEADGARSATAEIGGGVRVERDRT